jgi:hypothetical protein
MKSHAMRAGIFKETIIRILTGTYIPRLNLRVLNDADCNLLSIVLCLAQVPPLNTKLALLTLNCPPDVFPALTV